MNDPASTFGRRIANRVLEDESWARERLKAHAGRSFSMSSGPIRTTYVIRADGILEPFVAPEGGGAARADVELHVAPLDVPTLLSDPSRWEALVTSHGDPTLIATLQELAGTLPWFVERGFAKAFGPVVGQRIADTGRALLGFPAYASERAGRTMRSFAREEAGVVAHGEDWRSFAADSAALAERVESLAVRVDRLAEALLTRAQN